MSTNKRCPAFRVSEKACKSIFSRAQCDQQCAPQGVRGRLRQDANGCYACDGCEQRQQCPQNQQQVQ